ncbi:MAG: ROK family protein [Ruminococcaceae bacterium]|nr:ROK family protein [Oscillospiraceae bacterium]
MNNISLKSIKYESIKSIFTSIADTDRISRAEISEKTDLSLVTVGKIADALLDLNAICQIKEIKPQAGRRAGILSVNNEKFALIFDITSYDFRYVVLDLRLNLVEKRLIPYRSDIGYAENLSLLLSEAALYINRKYDLSNCFGVGVSVPGPYNSSLDVVKTKRIPELCGLHLNHIVSHHFSGIPLLIDSHINAAARSNVTHIPDYLDKNVIYWYVGNNYVCGAYIVNGELILGRDRHACNFGGFIDNHGNTLEKRISSCTDQKKCAEELVNPIYNVIMSLNPHAIIMEFDMGFPCDDVISSIRTLLTSEFSLGSDDIPDFLRACCKFRNAHRGLTMGLRELWLNKLIDNDNII